MLEEAGGVKDRAGEGRGWTVSQGRLRRAVKAGGGILDFVLRVVGGYCRVVLGE